MPKRIAEDIAEMLTADDLEALIGTGGFGDMIVDAAKRIGKLP